MLQSTDQELRDVAGLEASLGKPSQLAQMLEIDHIDAHIRALVAHARLAVVSARQADGAVYALPVCAREGLCEVLDDYAVRLLRPPGAEAEVGSAVGTLLIVQGLGETVRLNGRLLNLTDTHMTIRVDEAIVHCAKAFLRSEFWTDQSPPIDPVTDLLTRSPLACIGSVPLAGPADVSPKGECSAVARLVAADLIAIPERPGNRRHDTFRNVVGQPQVGVLFLAPGRDVALHVQGALRVVVDEALNATHAAEGKPSRAVSLVAIERQTLLTDLGLTAAGFWDRETWADPAELPSIGQIMHDHILLHRDRGEAAAKLRASLDLAAMHVEAEDDYKTGLW